MANRKFEFLDLFFEIQYIEEKKKILKILDLNPITQY